MGSLSRRYQGGSLRRPCSSKIVWTNVRLRHHQLLNHLHLSNRKLVILRGLAVKRSIGVKVLDHW
eukprot:6489303-Amphidinium_carterae.1